MWLMVDGRAQHSFCLCSWLWFLRLSNEQMVGAGDKEAHILPAAHASFQQHGRLPSPIHFNSQRSHAHGQQGGAHGRRGGEGMDLKELYLPHPRNLVVIYYLNIQLYNDPHSVYRTT